MLFHSIHNEKLNITENSFTSIKDVIVNLNVKSGILELKLKNTNDSYSINSSLEKHIDYIKLKSCIKTSKPISMKYLNYNLLQFKKKVESNKYWIYEIKNDKEEILEINHIFNEMNMNKWLFFIFLFCSLFFLTLSIVLIIKLVKLMNIDQV